MTSRFTQTLLRSTRSYSTTPVSNPMDVALRIALKASMKSRNSFRSGVIKGILSDLLNATKLAGPPPAEIKTLTRAITARLDAAAIFRSATPPREDLAIGNDEEIAILREFAPLEAERISAEEVNKVVGEVMKELGLEVVTGKDAGLLIKEVLNRVGKDNGKAVSDAVKLRMY